MDKNKLMSILKSVVIILAILVFVSFLRFEAAELRTVPAEAQDYFRDANGLPYFTELDSYYNLRMTQDLINNGHFGEKLVDGEPWDILSYAPDGRSADYTPMLSYVTILLHDMANMFKDMSIKEVAFFASAIIAPFAAIPAFIFVRRLTNNYGGAAAALITALSPSYFTHSFAGFFDTDMLAVVFPLFMTLFFVESIRSSKLIYRVIYITLTIVSIVLLSLSWDGYVFYLAVLPIVMIVYLLLGFLFKLHLIKPIKQYPNIFTWFANQKEIFSILMIAIFGFIGLVLTNGFEAIMQAPFDLIGATRIQEAASATAFPNVAISIGELQVPSVLSGGIFGAFLASGAGVINAMGGIVPFFGVLTVLTLMVIRLYKLHSTKIRTGGKKPPKGQREASSIVKENEGKKSIMELTTGNFKSDDDVNKAKRETLLYLTLFGVWIAILIVALTQGSRFIREFMVPVSLCIGLFVGYASIFIKNRIENKNLLMLIATVGSLLTIYPFLQTLSVFYPLYNIPANWVNIITLAILLIMLGISALLIYGFKAIKSSKFATTVVVVMVLLAVVSPTVFYAFQVSESVRPSIADPMDSAMIWTKANTTNNTILASWWDFGYYFQFGAERATIFDGGSQTGIRAFWTGKALMTNDTDLSAAIFQMMAYTGDNATNALDNITNNSGKSVEILENTLTLSAEEAKNKMVGTYNLTSSQADEIVKLTHPTNPTPVIFVASSDMIQKAYWWSYFGSWDFKTQSSSHYTYMASEQPEKVKSTGNGTYGANITNSYDRGILYQTVISKGVANNTTNATTRAVFENGTPVIVNNTTYNPFKVYNLIMIEDNIIWKNETVNESGNYTLLVIGDNGTYSSIIMNKELESSMFTKLYILGGFGQSAYELVHMEQGVSLWKISGIKTLKNETGST